jgi:hypothetical protein
VTVELFQVVEVVLQTNRVVEAAPQIENHAPFARNPVEQAREIGPIREVRRHLHDEEGKIDAVEVGCKRQRGQSGMRLAVNRDVMPEGAAGRGELVDGCDAAHPWVDRCHEQ